MSNKVFPFLLIFLVHTFGFSPVTHTTPESPKYDIRILASADSLYDNMTLQERVGQLFMIRAQSDKGAEHKAALLQMIDQLHIGGLAFFQGTPEKQVDLIREYQRASEIPLLIATDAEWGLGMRFKEDELNFPRQMTLGALRSGELIYQMGLEIGRQLRLSGVHMNFAPVVDVNSNPKNPVIGDRSFGDDPVIVASKSYQYMRGLQDAGAMACAKHFPGHGDTHIDSHKDLPVIHHSLSRIDSIDLLPYKVLIEKGLDAVMVAHIDLPKLDSRKNRPATLSQKIVTGLLKKKLDFNGLIITDALEMKGISDYYDDGVIAVEALKAGNDILLMPLNVYKAFDAVEKAVINGVIPQARLRESVVKILYNKLEKGLFMEGVPPSLNDWKSSLVTPQTRILKERLIDYSVTLVKDDNGLLPIKEVESSPLVLLTVGDKGYSFFNRLNNYAPVKHLSSGSSIPTATRLQVEKAINSEQLVIISIHKYGRKINSDVSWLREVSQNPNVVIVLFGSPYAAGQLDISSHLIIGYEDEDTYQESVAEAIFGAEGFHGRLPVTAGKNLPRGTGVIRPALFRLGYTTPEAVGVSSDSLQIIDDLAQELIDKKASPGCQILIARKGKIIYDKSFGHHTYQNIQKVQPEDIYDLASITKVMATTLAIMKLYEEGKIDIFQSIGNYLPTSQVTDKKDILIVDIMTHTAGLKSWIPFYKTTLKQGKLKYPHSDYYSKVRNEPFLLEVAENLYLDEKYSDSIYHQIFHSEFRSNTEYQYSDLGFILLRLVVEKVTGMDFENYVHETFYQPLHLKNTGFRPLHFAARHDIIPSEDDNYFRHQMLRGHVHDMAAAMLDGVSGHAGLFSNSRELAVLGQMLLNGGYYGGTRYLDPIIIRLFTERPPGHSRRAIGWDMKQLNEGEQINISELSSNKTFGHFGFTGTCIWMDPVHDLLYIFLSNRTYPTMNNRRLIRGDYRNHIQSQIYKSLLTNPKV